MFDISEDQKSVIQAWNASLGGDVTLRYATPGHTADAVFSGFIDQLAQLSHRLRPRKDPDALVPRPTLFASRHVAYQALPLDRELEPFLSVLANSGTYADRIGADVQRELDRLQMPAMISVYVTPTCPFCPQVVVTLLGLASLSEHVWVTVIDGMQFPDAAEKDRITSTPTVILDERLRWTGSLDAAELVAMMRDRDPVRLSATALRGMIESGDAGTVARMMAERQALFPSFLELLIHPRWPVRLGAMVAFENLAEAAPMLAADVVAPLIAAYPALDDAIRGDLLHVIGESGNRGAVPFLSDVVRNAEDDEVRNAAEEAIEKLGAAPIGDG